MKRSKAVELAIKAVMDHYGGDTAFPAVIELIEMYKLEIFKESSPAYKADAAEDETREDHDEV